MAGHIKYNPNNNKYPLMTGDQSEPGTPSVQDRQTPLGGMNQGIDQDLKRLRDLQQKMPIKGLPYCGNTIGGGNTTGGVNTTGGGNAGGQTQNGYNRLILQNQKSSRHHQTTNSLDENKVFKPVLSKTHFSKLFDSNLQLKTRLENSTTNTADARFVRLELGHLLRQDPQTGYNSGLQGNSVISAVDQKSQKGDKIYQQDQLCQSPQITNVRESYTKNQENSFRGKLNRLNNVSPHGHRNQEGQRFLNSDVPGLSHDITVQTAVIKSNTRHGQYNPVIQSKVNNRNVQYKKTNGPQFNNLTAEQYYITKKTKFQNSIMADARSTLRTSSQINPLPNKEGPQDNSNN